MLRGKILIIYLILPSLFAIMNMAAEHQSYQPHEPYQSLSRLRRITLVLSLSSMFISE